MADHGTCEVTDNVDEDNGTIITVLSNGNAISYVIPSFPVYCAKLVEVKIQYYNEDRNLKICNAFAKDCEDMNHPLPAFAKVNYGYENAFVVEVRLSQCGLIMVDHPT